MKVLSLQTSKRLHEAGIEVETEKTWIDDWWTRPYTRYNNDRSYTAEKLLIPDAKFYPAINLEEAIELLPKFILKDSRFYVCDIRPWLDRWFISYDDEIDWVEWLTGSVEWKTLIKSVEKMIKYLLYNKLLWNKK